MGKIFLKGFHACKNENGYQYIREHIPFLSEDRPDEWLTQGYYFWTDSPHWAEKWNVNGKGKKKVIACFDIELNCDDDNPELLDLVGNVKQQIEFNSFIDTYVETYGEARRAQVRKELTVNQVVSYLRENDIFPYLAIKAQDRKSEKIIGFRSYVDDYTSKRELRSKHKKKWVESLSLITRQQLCVFEEARERIKLKYFHEPKSFEVRFSEEVVSIGKVSGTRSKSC